MKSGPPWRASSLAKCSLAGDARTDTHNVHPGPRITISLIMTLPFQYEWQNEKIFPMQIVKYKIGCAHQSLQISCVHFASIYNRNCYFRSLTFGKYSLKVSAQILLPIYFQVRVRFHIPNRMVTPTQTEMPK